jgi:Tfp pilus assembly protein PilF
VLSLSVSKLSHPTSNPTINKGIALGYMQVNSGSLPLALSTFSAIISDDPLCTQALVGLGTVKAMGGDLGGAMECMIKATEEGNTVMSDAWKRRGQVAAAIGRKEEARECVRKAIGLDRDDPDPDSFNQLGNLLFSEKRFKSALEEGFLMCLKILGDPKDDPDASFSRKIGGGGLGGVYNMVGLCHSNTGDFPSAFSAFERAITIDPSSREYRANLGQLLKDVGKGREAMAAFEGAVEVDKGYAQAFHLGGLCKYGMGEIREAKEWFNRSLEAIRRNPEKNSLKVNVPGLFHMMGVCEVGEGRYEMAMKVRDKWTRW